MGLGLTAFSIDYAWVGTFGIIENHYDFFGFAILIGLVCFLVALIGWATLLDKRRRAHIATCALIIPLFILVTAGLSTNGNVHGVFPIFFIAMAPVMLVGFTVAIMAAKAKK